MKNSLGFPEESPRGVLDATYGEPGEGISGRILDRISVESNHEAVAFYMTPDNDCFGHRFGRVDSPVWPERRSIGYRTYRIETIEKVAPRGVTGSVSS